MYRHLTLYVIVWLGLRNATAALSLSFLSRRFVLSSTGASICTTIFRSNEAHADDDVSVAYEDMFSYEKRDRKANKNALIREDYWYMSNSLPPRKLDALSADFDNPKWNTWGTCETSAAGNSCTYVSLSQRIPAYSKYAFNIRLGASDFSKLGSAIFQKSEPDWDIAASYLNDTPTGMPSPMKDSLLKSALFATGMLTSPNYSGPPKELLVARFYVNEVAFSVEELRSAVMSKDSKRAKAAWEFGKDSWNSYFTVVNKNIVPKVGDKFEKL